MMHIALQIRAWCPLPVRALERAHQNPLDCSHSNTSRFHFPPVRTICLLRLVSTLSLWASGDSGLNSVFFRSAARAWDRGRRVRSVIVVSIARRIQARRQSLRSTHADIAFHVSDKGHVLGVDLVGVDRNGAPRVAGHEVCWASLLQSVLRHGAVFRNSWGYTRERLRVVTQAARRLEQLMLDRPEGHIGGVSGSDLTKLDGP